MNDNILMASMRGRAGQVVGTGFSGKKSQLGVRMTAAVKKLGCSNLKTMMDDDYDNMIFFNSKILIFFYIFFCLKSFRD